MEQPRVKNPTVMLILYGTVIAVVIYWFYQVVCNYLAGGPDAPNLATVIVGGIVMLGVFILRIIFVALTMLGIDPSMQNVIKGAIILAACSLDMRKYLTKK